MWIWQFSWTIAASFKNLARCWKTRPFEHGILPCSLICLYKPHPPKKLTWTSNTTITQKGNPLFERFVLDTQIMFIFQANIMRLVMSKNLLKAWCDSKLCDVGCDFREPGKILKWRIFAQSLNPNRDTPRDFGKQMSFKPTLVTR